MFRFLDRRLVALAVVAAASLVVVCGAFADEPAADTRVFELRTYIANEGKMSDLHKRFREHTNRIFEKHGMTLVGYWTPVEGDEAADTLVYMLAFPSREARDKSWQAFRDDPEWQAVYKASHVNGPLVKKVVSQILTPTDYSPIK